MLGRLVIDAVQPSTPAGYPAKAAVGEVVPVSADIFADGHDVLSARVLWRPTGDAGAGWESAPLLHVGNDRWEGELCCSVVGAHEMVVEAWRDRWGTFVHDTALKVGAGVEVSVEMEDGARLLEAAGDPTLEEVAATLRDERRTPEERMAAAQHPSVAERMSHPLPNDHVERAGPFPLWVDRERALFSAWYELFPRSEGGLVGTTKRLDDIAAMGFDVVYLPPVHPIGRSHRKGPGNTLGAGSDDPGSPWAIGGPEGGHTELHPELGRLSDFEALVARAHELGMEVALDYALQCSPDHPWVRDHPAWFHRRSDGSIAYAENPPKKYQDIYPINFWPDEERERQALWSACRDIFEVWIERGVRIFRVDNPHTKPFAFWEWVIADVRSRHPDVLFLAEAFTRPKVMAKLAEVGFSLSYTYFTWRTARWELEEYLEEVTAGPTADYMRPSFWPNTPDILSGPLRNGPPSAFRMRLLLAALMVPCYGIYSGYELCENEPASPANEEYANSEKYELKRREWTRPDSLAPFIAKVNSIRRRHPAFQRLRGVKVHGSDNTQLVTFSRRSADGRDTALVVVNLDPWNVQSGFLDVDLAALGIDPLRPYQAHDELSGETYDWHGRNPWVRLDPGIAPGHVLVLRQ